VTDQVLHVVWLTFRGRGDQFRYSFLARFRRNITIEARRDTSVHENPVNAGRRDRRITSGTQYLLHQ